PQPPDRLIDMIVEQQQCRVVLLTPAMFTEGYRPTQLLQPLDGVVPELMAAAVGRPQIATGWDYQKNEAKPSRRLAPAGSVYWLKLAGSPAAIRAWAKKQWMNSISDDDQSNRDGFGLAVLGTWNQFGSQTTGGT
ncbi:MAG: type III-B CRISPR module-associated Cmr3 family protein, partial [Roseiflexaceae bacterium]|nr:type III-B CRISPR module-associated Cmr3 family protein [Roseiflexaceae bacterium]